MRENNAGYDKEEQTFEPNTNFEEILHVFGDHAPLFDDFEDSEEAG